MIRNGKEVERQVKVGQMEEEGAAETAKAPSHQSLGLAVQNLTPEIAGELGIDGTTGVVVTKVEPDNAAAEAKIRVGDVIKEVNRKSVNNVDGFTKQLAKVKGGERVLLLLQRGQNNMFAVVKAR